MQYCIGDRVAYNDQEGTIVNITEYHDLWITGQELLRCSKCGTIEA